MPSNQVSVNNSEYLISSVTHFIDWCSSTHERKSRTNVVTKHNKFYVNHNSFTEVTGFRIAFATSCLDCVCRIFQLLFSLKRWEFRAIRRFAKWLVIELCLLHSCHNVISRVCQGVEESVLTSVAPSLEECANLHIFTQLQVTKFLLLRSNYRL